MTKPFIFTVYNDKFLRRVLDKDSDQCNKLLLQNLYFTFIAKKLSDKIKLFFHSPNITKHVNMFFKPVCNARIIFIKISFPQSLKKYC